MFQYALARRLSLEKGVPFKLDISYFRNKNLTSGELSRDYQLSVFNIKEDIASDEETNKFRNPSFLQRQKQRIFYYLLPLTYQSYFREKDDLFDPRVFKSGNNVYLFGYWQDERYFKPIENIIREDFTFKNPPDKMNVSFLKLIQQSNAVSIHVRRTDYVTDKNYFQNVGVCGIDYYLRAIGYIKNKVKHPCFFIFSDDPKWVKNNLKIEAKIIYIEHNSIEKGYEDLRLMINCKNHIIANSSFSWWGAWLSDYPQKIVIAPKVWQQQNNQNRVLPADWIRL
jgi:hypothetical protein